MQNAETQIADANSDPPMTLTRTAAARTAQDWPLLLEVAVQEVFEIMLGERPRKYDGSVGGQDLTAIVGLAGLLCGVLAVRCAYRTAAQITLRMLGTSAPDITQNDAVQNSSTAQNQNEDQMWDALGEICNMIAGNFKNKLPNIAAGCLLSVPTVVIGQDYQLRPRGKCQRFEVAVEFAGAPFAVTLDIHS
jgi:chemotaxis protein CheX